MAQNYAWHSSIHFLRDLFSSFIVYAVSYTAYRYQNKSETETKSLTAFTSITMYALIESQAKMIA